MDWFKVLDEYCERVSPSFWSEPLNAISNISFLIAAYFAFRLTMKQQGNGKGGYWLSAILVTVGLGSFLFHTFANLWSMFADIIPIYLFQITLIGLYGAAFATFYRKPKILGILILFIIFFGLTIIFSRFPREILNGSLSYASALIMLLLIAGHQYRISSRQHVTLFIATTLFAIAIVFRTVDSQICNHFVFGTHFLWHSIDGIVLYLAISAYIDLVGRKGLLSHDI